MMAAAEPLRAAIEIARRLNRELDQTHRRLGTRDNPNGVVLRPYRTALRALRDELERDTGRSFGVSTPLRDILSNLETTVMAGVQNVLADGFDAGRNNARDQLDAYGLPTQPDVFTDDPLTAGTEAVRATVRRQTAGALAILASGADPVLVTGDEDRQGVLRPSSIVRDAADWTSVVALTAFASWIRGSIPGTRTDYGKVAVAWFDNRTTETCRHVHGQTQAFDDPFDMGHHSPRYANKIDFPPFHWYCRTAVALQFGETGSTGIIEEMLAGGF